MKYILAAFAITLGAGAVSAQPMWEIADHWTCDLTARAEMDLANQKVNFLEQELSYQINFANNTRTSSFVSTIASIDGRRYSEGAWGNHNVLDINWDGQPYPIIMTQSGDVFWTSTVSGENGRSNDLIFVYYKCTPDLSS